MANVYFDSVIKNRKGEKIPFYDITQIEGIKDGELRWVHERHGLMKLYRFIKVDECNYIAEYLNKTCRKGVNKICL